MERGTSERSEWCCVRVLVYILEANEINHPYKVIYETGSAAQRRTFPFLNFIFILLKI